MKVKFLKQHNEIASGTVQDLPDGLANYLIQCTVVEPVKDKVLKEKLDKK